MQVKIQITGHKSRGANSQNINVAGVLDAVHHVIEILAVRTYRHLPELFHVGVQHRAQHILLVKQFPGGFDALGGGQAAANHFLQGPLHTGIAVVAQLRSKAYNRGFTDPNQLAQFAGSHESRLVVMLQNIRRDPLLPLGKVAHTALNTM